MLADYSDWPYLAQVFKLEYRTWCCVTGKASVDIRYGVTSAPVTVLDAQGLLQATRRHWGWKRDCMDGAMSAFAKTPCARAPGRPRT